MCRSASPSAVSFGEVDKPLRAMVFGAWHLLLGVSRAIMGGR